MKQKSDSSQWEKEFDKPEWHDSECIVALTGGGGCNCMHRELKDFIRQTREQAKQEVRQDLKKKVEGMKRTVFYNKDGSFVDYEAREYNQALSDILKLLEE
jgi:hypothetical protein